MSERCESCRYWREERIPRGDFKPVSIMRCRRHPPAIGQPTTKHDDWCGEWRERERDPMAPDQR